MEISMKSSSDFRWFGDISTCRIGAAFSHQKIHDASHHGIVGATDQRCRLPLLVDEADHQQSLKMVGKCRTGELELGLELADAHPGIARANERTIDFQAGGIAKGFKAGCCIINLHAAKIIQIAEESAVFLEYSKYELFSMLANLGRFGRAF
jgi:hypothetical protein